MPTYGYRCHDCEREFDVWQRMTDEPKATCPTCGGSGKRLFFPAGLVFKGSGFYVTDNRRGSGANGSKAAPAESKPAKSASDKSKPDSGSSSSSSTAGTSAGTASGSTSE